jgi:hypothetical protein
MKHQSLAPLTHDLTSLSPSLSSSFPPFEYQQEDLYSFVTVADVPNGFRGVGTKVVDDV